MGFCGMILVVTEGALLKESETRLTRDLGVWSWARLLPGSVAALGLGSGDSVATSPREREKSAMLASSSAGRIDGS